jgi:hypothetical protein
MPHPVTDLRAFLIGPWRIVRRISDARLGIAGRLTGQAVFTPSADGLTHDEKGDLSFGTHLGPASRRYRLTIGRLSEGVVWHADGSLFHALDLASGGSDILHRCGADMYRGRYRVIDENRFVVSWHVTGPRKRYRLATLHLRA